MKKFLSIVLVIMSLFAITGFVGESDIADVPARQDASAENVLRVGTTTDYPPFAYYQKATKTHIGFDIELMQDLGSEMGYDKVEFVQMGFNELLPSLQEGKVDAAIACMTVTDERKEEVDFTAPYLEGVKSGVIAPSGTKVRNAEALKDKRIAVETGSVHVNRVKQYSDVVIECGSAEDALKLVLDQKADFAVMDNFTARFYVTNFYKGKLNLMEELPDNTETGVGIAIAKGNKEMLDKLNAALQNYRGTAAYYQMKKSYFGKLEV